MEIIDASAMNSMGDKGLRSKPTTRFPLVLLAGMK